MLRFACFASMVIAMFAAFPVSAGNLPTDGNGPNTDNFCWEKSLDKDLQYMVAPIQSSKDLATYLSTQGTDSPLNLLSQRGKRDFLESLTFNKKGLTGLRHDMLEKELTPTQIYRVLALFGEQALTTKLKNARIETDLDREIMATGQLKCSSGDRSNYKCESRASCRSAANYICLAAC